LEAVAFGGRDEGVLRGIEVEWVLSVGKEQT
jgi:hypothetical protein